MSKGRAIVVAMGTSALIIVGVLAMVLGAIVASPLVIVIVLSVLAPGDADWASAVFRFIGGLTVAVLGFATIQIGVRLRSYLMSAERGT